MHKAFGFLFAVLILTLLGSLAVVAVVSTVDFVKNHIEDWRE